MIRKRKEKTWRCLPSRRPNPRNPGKDASGSFSRVSIRAKQSQFATDGPGKPSPRPSALTLLPARGPIVRNKANLGRQDLLSFHYPIIPPFQAGADCAKQSQFSATPGGARPRGGGTRGNPAKRSQTWAGWDIWGTAHGEANGTKQSQLGRPAGIAGRNLDGAGGPA
jgi:hypothetical protein